ncbi:hypothetical protein [Pectobacterium punjabense]|nr:hypothetical protein [Pectobacterium punjabense]MBN3138336.1 hypothetical protein [Pectobacterium punjabense]MCE5378818.1 hypothetical protein [Pectobacterium punjabense]
MSLKPGPKRTTEESEKKERDQRQRVDPSNPNSIDKLVPPLKPAKRP